ncbi:MAG: S-ribosylhomocysteine lyase [Clostridia bacterium]|nr:S-ribosylhomocysteine lyase [Clostridia bacterium]
MNKIKSFQVDHRKLDKGIYISRVDTDIVTYDLRFCKPNSGIVLDNVTMHTIEHMLATFARNSDVKNEVLYFGPMGCQTGFYLLVRDIIPKEKVLATVKDILQKTIDHNGEVFGASEIECGNYRTLDLESAKKACSEYLDVIKSVSNIIDYDEVNAKGC